MKYIPNKASKLPAREQTNDRREEQVLPTRLLKAPEPTEQGTEAAAKSAWAWRGTKTQRS